VSLPLLIVIEAALVGFFVYGWYLWHRRTRRRRRTRPPRGDG
jgi:uncharacterized iron-regulated membrane protein